MERSNFRRYPTQSIYITKAANTSEKGRLFGPTKTKGSRRQILISSYEAAELKKYREWQENYSKLLGDLYTDQGLVLTAAFGGNLDYSKFTKHFRELVKRENLKTDFHNMRHTHASLLLAKGIHPKVVQERLGHSSITLTLDTYSHLIPTMQQTAAEAMHSIFQPDAVQDNKS